MRIDHSIEQKKIKLDVKDKKILDILSTESRIPITQLSKKVEISRDSASYRISRLEKLGAIDKFYPRIDFKKLGFNTYHIFFSLNNSGDFEGLINVLKNHDSTLFIFEYNDKWDIEWVLICNNIEELDLEVTKIQAKFSETIIERFEILEITRYQSILFTFYFNSNLKKIDQEEKELSKVKSSHDEIDLKILELLCIDARLSTYEIAKNISVNADTVGIRIKKMLNNGVIRKFSILPNLNKVGFNWYTFCVNMKTFDTDDEIKFRKFIENHPGIIRCAKSFGDYDIIMYIMAKNVREFHSLVKEIKLTFPLLIRDYSTFILFKEHFYEPFPKRILRSKKEN